LFYQYLRILRETKPKYFLLENVKCRPKDAAIITEALGVDFIHINSSLVSGQNRARYYWTNIPNVTPPEDRGLMFRDVIKKERTWLPLLPWTQKEWGGKKKLAMLRRVDAEKSFCLTTNKSHCKNYYLSVCESKLSKLDADEAEILQTVPSGYTNHVPEGARFKMLGNGWTVDVIAHILKGME
jgi:site-specific DNA-cytosine methylase